MEENNRITSVVFCAPENIYNEFKKRISLEGFTVQDAMTILMINYISGRYDIEHM